MSIKVDNLNFKYGRDLILENINFTLKDSQLVMLLGKNGAGKSTLFKCILSLLKNYAGDIFIDDENLKNLKINEIAKKISYVPQENYKAFNYTVEEMVLMSTTVGKLFGSPREKENLIMSSALKKMGIEKLKHRFYLELSGGEKQLVLIARAIAQDTKIIVMDEPISNLDFTNQINIMECIKNLTKGGYLVILTSHNPDFALQYADRVLLLKKGKLILDGRAEEVMTDETLSYLYDTPIKIKKIIDLDRKVCIPG